MNKWLNVILWLFGIFLGFIILILIIGIIVTINEPSNQTIKESSLNIEVIDSQETSYSINENQQLQITENKPDCPEQGMFESDIDYCVDLYVVGKHDSQVNYDTGKTLCSKLEYYSGSDALKKKIESYKCTKCGIC